MNKLHIFGMMALAMVSFSSCEDDTDPKLQEPTEFVLNTPPFATQLYDLTPNGVIELTCSQPNYGLTLATTYGVEISMLEDFGANLPAPGEGEAPHAVTILPVNPQSAVIEIPESKIAEAICAMRGITSEEEYTEIPAHPLYVRALAHINNQPATKITSNTVTLTQVKGYCAFEAESNAVLYTPGNSNGWNQNDSQWLVELADQPGKFHGFIFINGEFKFTNQPDWNGTNYGKDTAAEDGLSGTLSTDGGAGNLPMPPYDEKDYPNGGEGLYYAEVDINTLTYKLTKITSVGFLGEFNDWAADAPIEMTSDNYLVWTAEEEFSGAFKFIFNGPTTGWKYNLGGTFDELSFGGDNLSAGDGKQKVTLDLRKIPYTAAIEIVDTTE